MNPIIINDPREATLIRLSLKEYAKNNKLSENIETVLNNILEKLDNRYKKK